VVIDTPCLDCGEPIHLEVKDGVILKVEPVETIGYVAVPFARWWENVSYA
jgi:hypothetical protein